MLSGGEARPDYIVVPFDFYSARRASKAFILKHSLGDVASPYENDHRNMVTRLKICTECSKYDRDVLAGAAKHGGEVADQLKANIFNWVDNTVKAWANVGTSLPSSSVWVLSSRRLSRPLRSSLLLVA